MRTQYIIHLTVLILFASFWGCSSPSNQKSAKDQEIVVLDVLSVPIQNALIYLVSDDNTLIDVLITNAEGKAVILAEHSEIPKIIVFKEGYSVEILKKVSLRKSIPKITLEDVPTTSFRLENSDGTIIQQARVEVQYDGFPAEEIFTGSTGSVNLKFDFNPAHTKVKVLVPLGMDDELLSPVTVNNVTSVKLTSSQKEVRFTFNLSRHQTLPEGTKVVLNNQSEFPVEPNGRAFVPVPDLANFEIKIEGLGISTATFNGPYSDKFLSLPIHFEDEPESPLFSLSMGSSFDYTGLIRQRIGEGLLTTNYTLSLEVTNIETRENETEYSLLERVEGFRTRSYAPDLIDTIDVAATISLIKHNDGRFSLSNLSIYSPSLRASSSSSPLTPLKTVITSVSGHQYEAKAPVLFWKGPSTVMEYVHGFESANSLLVDRDGIKVSRFYTPGGHTFYEKTLTRIDD